MPVMDRATLQRERDELGSCERPPDEWRSTGGSTAEPIQVDVWKSEADIAAQDLWYARGWYDVSPSDRLFLIWGHSHLLGSGIRGRIAGTKRRFKDTLLGYLRWSAYDLSEETLRHAAEALLKFRPRYIIAYAVALERFAQVNRDRKKAFHSLGLKVAIATAEAFPRPDSAGFIADVLGCPVTMEYGAVETGPIAHQTPNGEYSVFWRHHFVEGRITDELENTYDLLVTCLFPRCSPLIRYRVGDLILPGSDDEYFGQQFGRVVGRSNDYIVLGNGRVVHSEAFSHVVKDFPYMSGYQVIQSAYGDITLNYIASRQLETSEVEQIRWRLGRIDDSLTSIGIERVYSLPKTIAGKTRHILREHAQKT